MRVISKDKPKGSTYDALKHMKKKKKFEAIKEAASRTEYKRQNAESRKERAEKNDELSRVSQVEVLDFVKGMLIVKIEGKQEKRALQYDDRKINLENLKDNFSSFEVKLYGENYKIKHLKNFSEKFEELLWKVESLFV